MNGTMHAGDCRCQHCRMRSDARDTRPRVSVCIPGDEAEALVRAARSDQAEVPIEVVALARQAIVRVQESLIAAKRGRGERVG